MKYTDFFIPTLREEPTDAVVQSHKLMLRSGMIKQLTSGVYSYLPFGLLVFRKIERIVREEMNKIGGKEFYLPALSPNELWHQSGRLEEYGDDLFIIKNRELVLAPTHEEVFTSIAKQHLLSYKDFPQVWYQIQTKFRNEARPRGGVLRSRQFTMKDSYSFDTDEGGLDVSYKKHDIAYRNIFTRCGLKFFVVSAFSGAMGGSESEEFMVMSDAGEDNIAISEDGSYTSNLEIAVTHRENIGRRNTNLPYEDFHTPDIKSIEELAEFLKITDKSRLAKSRVYVTTNKETQQDNYILVLVCGDDEVNEAKLHNYLGSAIRPGHPEELLEITGADAGSIGPVGLKRSDIRIIADNALKDADELVSGANKNDYHIKNIDLKRDVKNIEYTNLRIAKDGELTIDKKSKISIVKAIEVGHIFKLGRKYAEALSAKFLDKDGKERILIMGSYGIGIERIAAAYIEQNHDKFGIIWDGEISPFQLELIYVNSKIENVKDFADDVYNKLLKENYEVFYDDRKDLSPGVKFNDADLIGIPYQVIISEKNIKNNEIEIKNRKSGERIKIPADNLLQYISDIFSKNI